MLINLLRQGSFVTAIPTVLISAFIVLISLSFHEMSHAFVASLMGDKTAKSFGRISMNPMRHLDPIGAVCMLLFGFGWAKPVPVNARNFKNPKYGMALTAFAGPIGNIVLAFIGLILFRVCTALFPSHVSSNAVYYLLTFVLMFFQYLHLMNLYLAVFNLLPIPPLDGSRILFIFLPSKYYFSVMKYERIISLVIFVLLWTGILSRPLSILAGFISDGMSWIVDIIAGVF